MWSQSFRPLNLKPLNPTDIEIKGVVTVRKSERRNRAKPTTLMPRLSRKCALTFSSHFLSPSWFHSFKLGFQTLSGNLVINWKVIIRGNKPYDSESWYYDALHCWRIISFVQTNFKSQWKFNTAKLGIKKLLNKEQTGFKELFTDYQSFYIITLLLNKEL